jgi:hypothetical protein
MLQVSGRRRVTLPAVLAAAAIAAITIPIAQSLYQVPVQVSDSLEPMVLARKADSAMTLLESSVTFSPTTLRPSRYLQARWLIELADDVSLPYNTVFRGVHVALLALLVVLFAAAVRVSTWTDLVAFTVAFPVLLGMHTFLAMLLEAFPVNHYAEVSVCALAVFVLAQRAPRWYVPVAASVLLVLALSVIESGAMVWVTVLCCAAAGLRGITRATVIATTVLFGAYLILRHQLGIVSPGIGAHGSGFGATFYSPEELVQRFGAHPAGFMFYNVTGGLLSLLFSEPRNGVYTLLAAWREREVHAVVAINVLSSLAMTLLLVWYAVTHLRAKRSEWTDTARTFAAAAAIVLVNAALTAVYIKDEIISVGGIFYAVCAFIAVRALVESLPRRTAAAALALTLLLAADATLWAFRAAGMHYQLRYDAFKTRNDWVEVLRADKRSEWPEDPRELDLTRRLRNEALQRRTASPSFMVRWGDRYWVE